MKKFFMALAIGTVCTITSPYVHSTVNQYDGNSQLESARTDIENWMKYLPDNMFVAHVSMPGSHDSATGHNVSSSSSAMAQSVLIDEQLRRGVRAFDFRPGFYKTTTAVDDADVTEVTIQCNHGIAKTELTFDQAFEKLTDYLTAHPTEFFAIHLFRGSPSSDPSAADQQLYNEAINKLFNSGRFANFFVDFDPYLTVGQMRGKIVVFKRDRISWVRINKAGNLGGWPSDEELWEPGKAAAAMNATNLAVTGRIRVTDVSSPYKDNTGERFNIKKNSITNLFNANCTQVKPNEAKANGFYKPEWSMIFTSGEAVTSGKKGYLSCAVETNPLLTQLIEEATVPGPTGIVFSDWVLLDKYTNTERVKNPDTNQYEDVDVDYEVKGDALVKAIIENNFKYAADYILDDALFNDETDIKTESYALNGKTFYLRNVENGKFLAAGADWGTHAVLADNGIRFKAFFDNRSGNYLLKTTFRQNGADNFLGSDCYIDNTAPQFFEVKKVEGKNAYSFRFNGVNGENNPEIKALGHEATSNDYKDGTTFIASYQPSEEDAQGQQWEILTEEDLIAELSTTASGENPADMSFMIRGHKFSPNDTDENSNWVFTTEQPKTSSLYCVKTEINGMNEQFDKEQVFRVYVGYFSANYPDNYSWELTREVIGLPEGLYTVSARAMADNMPMEGEGHLEFTANGEDMAKGLHTETTGDFTCAKAIGKFRDATLNNCEVKAQNVSVGSDGKLLLRIAKPLKTAPGKQSFYFNNLALKYQGSDIVTSVKELAEDITADTIVDVFTVSGVTVARGVHYGDVAGSLARGIYIIRSEESVKKVVI